MFTGSLRQNVHALYHELCGELIDRSNLIFMILTTIYAREHLKLQFRLPNADTRRVFKTNQPKKDNNGPFFSLSLPALFLEII